MTLLRDESMQAAARAMEAGILGGAMGDALGVPVEFTSRRSLRANPVVGLRGYGTHRQPAGTWSDDTSLTLCLVESLAESGIDFHEQAARFVAWMREAHWTAHGEVFDIGNATRAAIESLAAGEEPTQAGLAGELHCGNGSLMRLAPLGMYLAFADAAERARISASASRLTHGHPRCQLACIFYSEVIAWLVRGSSLTEALSEEQEVLRQELAARHPQESGNFERLLSPDLADLPESHISSSGYVLHCLEASLWCALRARSFEEGVLLAVNLGDDTDTTAAVAGTLLGLRFGKEQIPRAWLAELARLRDIEALLQRFQVACLERWRTEQ